MTCQTKLLAEQYSKCPIQHSAWGEGKGGPQSVFHFLTWIFASPLDIHLPAISNLISEFQARDYLYDPEDAKKFSSSKTQDVTRGVWKIAEEIGLVRRTSAVITDERLNFKGQINPNFDNSALAV